MNRADALRFFDCYVADFVPDSDGNLPAMIDKHWGLIRKKSRMDDSGHVVLLSVSVTREQAEPVLPEEDFAAKVDMLAPSVGPSLGSLGRPDSILLLQVLCPPEIANSRVPVASVEALGGELRCLGKFRGRSETGAL